MFGVFVKISSWASIWIYSSRILEVGLGIIFKQAAQMILRFENCWVRDP